MVITSMKTIMVIMAVQKKGGTFTDLIVPTVSLKECSSSRVMTRSVGQSRMNHLDLVTRQEIWCNL